MLPVGISRIWNWSVASDEGRERMRQKGEVKEGGGDPSRDTTHQNATLPRSRSCNLFVGIGGAQLGRKGSGEECASAQGQAVGSGQREDESMGALSLLGRPVTLGPSRRSFVVPLQDLLWLLVAYTMLARAEGMLLLPMQESGLGLTTSMTIIVTLIVFLFVVPVVCKIIHILRVQVNKIRNADIWGDQAEAEADDDDDDEY